MINFLKKILEWIKSLFNKDELYAIKIKNSVSMPLFYKNQEVAKIDSTWNYNAKNDSERKALIKYIKSMQKSNETSAITFCLTPSDVSGGLIDNKMENINETVLNKLVENMKELVRAGIAIFPCLYVDDCAPRWYNIKEHTAIWSKIHEKIRNYVTGYILSIETNEEAKSLSQIEDCIYTMRITMPGVDYYGTHLQWHSNNGKYSWIGSTNHSTPKNVNVLLVETSWDPRKGNAVGLQGLKNEYLAIKQREPNLNLIIFEYNMDPEGNIYKEQREWLRTQNPFGVG